MERGLFERSEFRSAFFGEARRGAEGLLIGWPFFWLLFFGHAKKSDSP